MNVCGACGAAWPDDAASCGECGADLVLSIPGPAADADGDEGRMTERERFKLQYGIDIGDRSVDEFLAHLERQDYTLTVWFWVVVVVELALVGLLVYAGVGPGSTELLPPLLLLSVLLSSSIYADTALVGTFEKWSRIRWTYIGLALVPYFGQIAVAIYLALRRFERGRTEQHRRRLDEFGFELDVDSAD